VITETFEMRLAGPNAEANTKGLLGQASGKTAPGPAA
jgi:hypothetical protein